MLVSGAGGFIGARVVAALVAAGYRVRALVRERAQVAERSGVEVVTGDLRDPASLVGVERDVELVVHCAGVLGTWGTADELLFQVNVEGTANLLERFRDGGLERFLHLSAGGVTGPLPSPEPVDESYPCRPATPYERSKLAAEQRVLERSAELGLAAAVVRPTFTYGPGDRHKLGLFRAIRKGRYGLLGGGGSVNHPVYVDDLVAGIVLALARARAGEVYILGGERPVSKRELSATIADALGVARPWLDVPLPLAWPASLALEAAGRVLGFEPILTRQRVLMMSANFGYSIAKARRELGYQPQVGIEEGIGRTVAAYRAEGWL